MSLVIKSLENTSVESIHATFVAAFSDYQVDVSYMTPHVMANRFIKNGFRPSLSAGVFDDGKLKGFTVVGTGMFKGELSAFDIMTGLVKDYRGKGLASKMFEFIEKEVKNAGVRKFYLEVLQENKPAIQAYEKTGFRKVRGLNCYVIKTGQFAQAKQIQSVVFITKSEHKDISDFKEFLDYEPSWENHPDSIQRISDQKDIYIARSYGQVVGVIVYYPTLNWIMSLAVKKDYRRKGIATAMLEYLMATLHPVTNEVKILNIPSDDASLNIFLMKSGFEYTVSQYEMAYELS